MSTWRITDIYFSTSIDELFDANGNFDDGPVLAENKIQFNYTPVNSNLSGHPNSVSAKPGLYQTSYLESIEGFNQKLELVLIEDDEADHIFYNYIQVNSGINIDVERKRIDKIKLYEKEIGTSNSFHVRTIDFNYNHPAADKRYYLEELAFQNAAGAVIEKYQFTYDNPENFPAFHDPQIVTASYENMNGYYSIANLNIND